MRIAIGWRGTGMATALMAIGLGVAGLGEAKMGHALADGSEALARLKTEVAEPYAGGPVTMAADPALPPAMRRAMVLTLDNHGWPVAMVDDTPAAGEQIDLVRYFTPAARDAAEALARELTTMRPGKVVRVEVASEPQATQTGAIEIHVSAD
ncbi:MAG: hypothetical protein ACFBRM_03845 [Pikeienuella sp.]